MDLRSGDRVGLVGPNGSGKSTLLRVVAGGYFPTCGEICVNGRVSALLSIGLGMDFDDTGYANIEICGLLVGMTAREIKAKLPDIATFSGLGEFLAMPMRTYSMGMALRLSFAIATAIEPDIFVVDEIIGAGNASFANRARQRIEGIMDSARILLLASHSPDTIRTYCNKAVYLRAGKMIACGHVDEVLALYHSQTTLE